LGQTTAFDLHPQEGTANWEEASGDLSALRAVSGNVVVLMETKTGQVSCGLRG